MKTTKLTLIIITFFSFSLFSQTPEEKKEDNKGSFVKYQFNPTDLNNWNNFFNEKEEIKERTIPVFISTNYINRVLENKSEVLDISLFRLFDNYCKLKVQNEAHSNPLSNKNLDRDDIRNQHR